jgi:hypothetical protein
VKKLRASEFLSDEVRPTEVRAFQMGIREVGALQIFAAESSASQ